MSVEVMGWPSENAAPRRRCQVEVLPSGLISQEVQSCGVSSSVALLKSTSEVNRRPSVTSDVDDSFPMMVLNVRGDEVSAKTNRPPCTPTSGRLNTSGSAGRGIGSL